jgi:SAM-dependent methyltransferase
MSNYYANIGDSSGQRDPVDRYETPDSVVLAAINRIELPKKVREPACGTGRVARLLKSRGHKVDATDIVEDGVDFRTDRRRFESLFTNPPYRDGLALEFAEHALAHTDGQVVMLYRTGFLQSQGRYALFERHPPATLIYLCRRIKFFKADGSRISGQAHDHVWVHWDTANSRRKQRIMFAGPDELYDAS